MSPITRKQRTYDHRFRELVQTTGDIQLATGHGVPASTARGWLNKSATKIVSIDILDLNTVQLQHEVIQLRRRVTKLTALLRLAIVVLKVTGFSFHRIRLADGDDKQRLLTAIRRTRLHVGVRTVLRAIGLSQTRYHDWSRDQRCALNDRTSCPRSSPQQLTPQEVNLIREMVMSPEYRHVPTSSLARLAQRLGKVFASSAT